MGLSRMSLLAALPLASGFSPVARPALARVHRAGAVSMIDGGFTSWLADAAILLPDADTASAAAGAMVEAVAEDSWFDTIVIKPFEMAIETLAGYSGYGPAIIIFTVAIKLLLFPLTKQQIESTAKMQAIQPAAKALQERYRERDPARLNAELQKLYQDNQVNPLAGCVPAIAQIPLFIGLYRALLLLAKENKLEQPFLWLPSLEGPVADYTQGIGWLTTWVDGVPPLGWSATAAYLVLPVLLVLSQYASMALLTPKNDDPAQAQSQAILKFLPLMIGWFSLNVPSGLGLYWLTNNIITTASTLVIRQMTPKLEIDIPGGAATMEPQNGKGFGGRRFGEVIEQKSESGTTIKIKPPGAPAGGMAPVNVVVEAALMDVEVAAVEGEHAEEDAARKKKPSKKKKKKN